MTIFAYIQYTQYAYVEGEEKKSTLGQISK